MDGTTMSIIELVRDIWMNNACVKFEERSLNPSKVIGLTTKLCVADENIIFTETCISREYNDFYANQSSFLITISGSHWESNMI